MREIPLTQGKVALVDDGDYDRVVAFSSWCAWRNRSGNWYAQGHDRAKKSRVYMHRMVLGFPAFKVDHHDRDGLNNQKQNLRPATRSQNQSNSRVRSKTGLKGVVREKRPRPSPWRAQITINGKNRGLGSFQTSEEAAAAYDFAARSAFGEFALTNSQLGLINQPT